LKQAKNELRRVERLKQTQAVSTEEYDDKEYAIRIAAARVESMKASVELAKLNLSFTKVKAPIAGRIGRDLVNPGNYISGGSANATWLTTIVSLSPIHFYMEAGEAEFLKYIRLNKSGEREGSRTAPNPVLAMLLDEKYFVHRGHMDFVDNEMDAQTGSILGRAIFDNPDQVIQPGMFARAKLIGSGKYEALLVPDTAIGTDQARKFVYVVGEGDKIEVRFVELGTLHKRKFRVVRKGLSVDDLVVVGNIQRVRAGSVVEPVVKDIAGKKEKKERS
jgi:RND family efflux transporter MFP subunit